MKIVLNNSDLVFARYVYVPDYENTVTHPNTENNSSLVITGLNLVAGHRYKITFKSAQGFTLQEGDNVRFTKDTLSAVSVVSPSVKGILPEEGTITANQEYSITTTAKSDVDLTGLRLGLYSRGANGCTIYMSIKDITE